MSSRPSPTNSATLYKTGTKKTGNDGNIWQVKETKTGVKRWKLFKKGYKTSKKTSKKSSKKNSKTSKKSSKKFMNEFRDLFYGFKKISEKKLFEIVSTSKPNIKKTILNLQKMFEEFRTHNYNTYIVPLPLSDNNIYWADYINTYIREKTNDNEWFKKRFIAATIYLDHIGSKINENNEITIEFTKLNLQEKEIMLNLLNKFFSKQYVWNEKNNQVISISFDNK